MYISQEMLCVQYWENLLIIFTDWKLQMYESNWFL
jgi:hypothetical protein